MFPAGYCLLSSWTNLHDCYLHYGRTNEIIVIIQNALWITPFELNASDARTEKFRIQIESNRRASGRSIFCDQMRDVNVDLTFPDRNTFAYDHSKHLDRQIEAE